MVKLIALCVSCLAIIASTVLAEGSKYEVKDCADCSSHKHQEHKSQMKGKSEGVRKSTGTAKELQKSDGQALDKLPKAGVSVKKKSEDPKTDATTMASPLPFTVEPSAYGRIVSCPVTGEKFKISKNTPAAKYKNKVYYLCCPACVEPFKKNPDKYIK
ncbi:MAG: TRASH domain-containing protein [Endomicrobiia bacterium]|nr:TRASH domain-containing protein [Endomicrobiia bacterium]